MGAAAVIVKGMGSYVDLIERPAGTPPPVTFSWAGERRYL
jgi:hypothetical protein